MKIRQGLAGATKRFLIPNNRNHLSRYTTTIDIDKLTSQGYHMNPGSCIELYNMTEVQ